MLVLIIIIILLTYPTLQVQQLQQQRQQLPQQVRPPLLGGPPQMPRPPGMQPMQPPPRPTPPGQPVVGQLPVQRHRGTLQPVQVQATQLGDQRSPFPSPRLPTVNGQVVRQQIITAPGQPVQVQQLIAQQQQQVRSFLEVLKGLVL